MKSVENIKYVSLDLNYHWKLFSTLCIFNKMYQDKLANWVRGYMTRV